MEVSDDSIVALKNVTINEPFFQGHFPPPRRSIMPGTMLIEGMAQTSAILAMEQDQGAELGFLTGVDGARFRRPVTPGDQVIFEGNLEKFRKQISKTKVEAFVEDELVSEAEIILTNAKEG